MKQSEYSKRSDSDLSSMEKELYSEALNIRLQHRSGGLKRTSSIKQKKRELARVKTEISKRRIASVGGKDA